MIIVLATFWSDAVHVAEVHRPPQSASWTQPQGWPIWISSKPAAHQACDYTGGYLSIGHTDLSDTEKRRWFSTYWKMHSIIVWDFSWIEALWGLLCHKSCAGKAADAIVAGALPQGQQVWREYLAPYVFAGAFIAIVNVAYKPCFCVEEMLPEQAITMTCQSDFMFRYMLQKESEIWGALFSSFQWAIYCWNLEETRKQAANVPAQGQWQQSLVSICRQLNAALLNTTESLTLIAA